MQGRVIRTINPRPSATLRDTAADSQTIVLDVSPGQHSMRWPGPLAPSTFTASPRTIRSVAAVRQDPRVGVAEARGPWRRTSVVEGRSVAGDDVAVEPERLLAVPVQCSGAV